MANYELTDNSNTITKNELDGGRTLIPKGHRLYKHYEDWVSNGGVPDPYVAPESHWIDKRLAKMAKGGYGSIGEQLEMIGEQGMDVFQAHIAKVKSDIPKE